MKRILIILLASLAALAAGLAPVSIAIRFAYTTTVENAEAGLYAIAEAIAADTSQILVDIDRGLIALAELTYDCTSEDVNAMNTMAYDIPEISELWLMRPDGKLVCTSWGPVPTPLVTEIPDSSHEFSLLGPMVLKMMNRFGLIAVRLRNDGSRLGAVIHPSILIGRLGTDLGEHGFAVLLRREDSHIFAWDGNVPELKMMGTATAGVDGKDQDRVVFHDDVGRTQFAVELEGYPGIYSLVAASDDWVQHDWIRVALILGAVGVGTSIFLLFLLLGMLKRRLSLQGELERSLQKDEFEINYLPVIDLKTGRCIGAEALISWVQPGGKVVRPDLFIPLAEDTGLIEPMTEWLMKQIRKEMEAFLVRSRDFHIAINLCPCHFESEKILSATSRVFGSSAILPNQLIYEITERGLIQHDDEMARNVMTTLRARDSHIALDDFGTGYSSLGYISSFPLDYLKIDKSFVSTIGTDSPMSGLVDSIIDMAKRLDLKIIAEGIETSGQRRFLEGKGVDFGQGWYYSKAIPAMDFIEFVRTFNKNT